MNVEADLTVNTIPSRHEQETVEKWFAEFPVAKVIIKCNSPHTILPPDMFFFFFQETNFLFFFFFFHRYHESSYEILYIRMYISREEGFE